jgi:hypothetical protein
MPPKAKFNINSDLKAGTPAVLGANHSVAPGESVVIGFFSGR